MSRHHRLIPRRFKVANRTWRVEFKRFRKKLGEADPIDAVIYLNEKLKRDPELLLHTFVHELLHATSTAMGWSRVNDDEDRLDALAGLLSQALTTAR